MYFVKSKSLQKKRVIAETNAIRQKQNNQDLCYYPPQYKNVRNSKVRYYFKFIVSH